MSVSSVEYLTIVLYTSALMAVLISGEACNITSSFKSPYVKARYEQTFNATGCTSRETSPSTSQEVHVINIQSAGPHSGQHGPNKVLLIVKDRQHREQRKGPLVFVLSSQQPVLWEISSAVSNTRHILVVPKESRVIKNRTLNMKIVKKEGIPHSSTELVQWVRRHYHAVTSYAYIQQANFINSTVGVDPNSAATCSIGKQQLIGVAGYFQSQSIRGCANKPLSGNHRDVHVIDLNTSKLVPQHHRTGKVLVDIRTYAPRLSLPKQMIVVLKSHQPVRWILQVYRVTGTIQIISNGVVDTGSVKNVTIQAIAEDLPKTRQSLLSTIQSRYDPILSYSQVQHANRFTIFVDGLSSRLRPNLGIRARIQGNTQRHHQPINVLRSQLLKRTYQEAPKSGFLSSPFEKPASAKMALRQALSMHCSDGVLSLTLKKRILEQFGVTVEQLSLKDHSCHAQENDTHYYFHTLLGKCGTERRVTPNGHIYSNKVVIRRLYDGDHDTDGYQHDGSGYNDDQAASGVWSNDETRMDDEDYKSDDLITADFQCQYPASHPEKVSIRSSTHYQGTRSSGLDFRLDFFSDEAYSTKVKGIPYHFLETKRVYVEAELTNADPHLRAVLHSCSLVSTEKVAEAEKQVHQLVQKGCGIEKSVEWHSNQVSTDSQSFPAKQRFSFIVYKFLDKNGNMEYYLQCNLTACTTDPTLQVPGIKKCIGMQQYCITENIKTENQQTSLERKKYLVKEGPLVIDRKPPLSTPSPKKSPTHHSDIERPIPRPAYNPPQDKGACQTVTVGLDSATVVGIAFAAFFIGVLLTAALWFIHTHTGPIKKKKVPTATLR